MKMPLCLAGPTASGKTAAALAIAQRWPVEIISVDSALVYRGMDIGTAKPSVAERAVAPHHLIDIRDPLQAYSAAEFVRDARTLIAGIQLRDRYPLLVGGTMLYFKALFDGLDDLPPADPKVRADLEVRARAGGWPALHTELARVDPVTAARLAPNDSQRIQRALEVWTITGQPLSAFHGQQRKTTVSADIAIDSIASHADSARSGALISLETEHRAWLHERIARRFDAMLAGGLLTEVQALRQRGDLHADLPSMRCVGYRQVWETLDGTAPAATLRERGIAATRQLAKRQMTWLRSMPLRKVVPCDAPDALDQVLHRVAAHWGPSP